MYECYYGQSEEGHGNRRGQRKERYQYILQQGDYQSPDCALGEVPHDSSLITATATLRIASTSV
jgi:hypothetical protein